MNKIKKNNPPVYANNLEYILKRDSVFSPITSSVFVNFFTFFLFGLLYSVIVGLCFVSTSVSHNSFNGSDEFFSFCCAAK